MEKNLLIFCFLLCCVICGIEGMCEHNGKTYQQKERYYTADCEKKCVCRKRGKFSCQPLCKKRTTPVCEYPFVKIVRVNGTNCTCAVVKCAKKPRKLKPATTVSTTLSLSTVAKKTETPSATTGDQGSKNRVHLIIIIAALAILMLIIVMIAVWRCWLTRTCLWKDTNKNKAEQDQGWTATLKNRPLPIVPPSDEHGATIDMKIPTEKEHSPRSVPNPYYTDDKLKRSQQTKQTKGTKEPNEPHHYQELDELEEELESTRCEYVVPPTLYTDLTGINEDEQPTRQTDDDDYLQPLSSA